MNNNGFVNDMNDVGSAENGKVSNGFSHQNGHVDSNVAINLETAGSTVTQSSEPERENWGKSIEFLMSCIAMSVGLGNVWRFPFTALENGGGKYIFFCFFLWSKALIHKMIPTENDFFLFCNRRISFPIFSGITDHWTSALLFRNGDWAIRFT